jgi:lipopolysaccharide transport system permease protein
LIEKQHPAHRVIYTPESPIRHPVELFAEMLSDLKESRALAWRLAVRDISAQYRQTAFGYLWAVLPPIVITLIWVLLNKSQFLIVKTGDIPYAVFALTGTVFWQLFLESVNAPLKQLGVNRSMLNRVNFPTEALLLSGIAQALFSFAIKLVVLAVALLLFQVPIKWTAVFLVFPILGLVALGTAIGMLLAPAGLLYKDVEQSLATLLGPLMFLAPVLYPPPAGGFLGAAMKVNPLTPMFTVTRDLLFGGVGPRLEEFALVSCAALVLTGVAWVVFRLALPLLIERLEA